MADKKKLLAYCGLYCGDCVGYTGVVADAALDFSSILDRHKFHMTAKSVFPEQLKEYEKFQEMLDFMTGLKCPGICRERADGSTSCEIRKCCIEHGYFACHECDDFETCDKLSSLMQGLHGEAILKNLREIRHMGVDAWIEDGKRYWFWDDFKDNP